MSSPTHKNLSSLIEQPESRSRNWTKDGLTETRIYIAEWDVAKAAQKAPNTLGSGDLSGYIIRSSNVDAVRGLAGRLTDVWAVGGDDADPETNPLPSDEVGVSATNQSPRTERHPRYISLAALTVGSGETLEYVMEVINTIARATDPSTRNINIVKINGSGLTAPQKALALNLVAKLRNGNESYYLATLRYSWATHSYSVPSSVRGGSIESISGPLASYFTGTISWLREADDLQFSNGIWRHTRSWLGADAWDSELYA